MEELQIFKQKDFGEIRILDDPKTGEVWFIGKDVAKALGYKDTDQALRKHVDSEDKLPRRFDGVGQEREAIFINESGLYSLIFDSKLPEAKAFKRWVTSEVLPSIRRDGYYVYGRTQDRFELTEELLCGYDQLQPSRAKALNKELLKTLKDQLAVLRAENRRLKRSLRVSEDRADELEHKLNDVQVGLIEQVLNLRKDGTE